MSTNPINSISSGYLQSIASNSLQNSGLTNNASNNIGATSLAPLSDNTQLSPFAQMMSELQQLQQSDPTKYAQVTQQIATNLQNAAQTAQSQGNTTAANQLTQLLGDFTNASKSGQLPSIQDLAQAMSGHHHHHHHGHGGAAGSANANANSLLSAFQTGSTQSDSLNPTSIILNTLSSAGVSGQ